MVKVTIHCSRVTFSPVLEFMEAKKLAIEYILAQSGKFLLWKALQQKYIVETSKPTAKKSCDGTQGTYIVVQWTC